MDDRLIVALDVDTTEKAIELVDELKNDVRFFKIGLELFSSCGPGIVNVIKNKGCEIFLDLKLHDIPNTVAKTAVVLTRLGAFMFNVHSLGGYDMMRRTVKTVEAEAKKANIKRPKILAVTILTSMDEEALKKVGINNKMALQVLRLATVAKEAGLDGVVASSREAEIIRKSLPGNFLIVTPGVRPSWAAVGDQKRVATPAEAIASGADYIVVGRPITEASDPCETARKILEEINGVKRKG